MALSAETKNRIFIALTDHQYSDELIAAVDASLAIDHPAVTLGAVGAVPNANGASVTAGQVITLQPASGALPGVVTAGAQTFGGVKTFSSAIVAPNLPSLASGTAAVAIGATSVTVTDAAASATSGITANFAEVDATAVSITRIERLAGSFVIHVNAAATAETDIVWVRVG